jgi:two-component system, cell cycle sensor histidine kinase and response regulator CckA
MGAHDRRIELNPRCQESEEVSYQDMTRLVHDLRLHQQELEQQNEELRNLHAQLEESRSMYCDFYDFSPVGFLTLDEEGIVKAANLTTEEMLDIRREQITGKPFLLHVEPSDRDIFYAHLQSTFESGERQSCELHIKTMEKETIVLMMSLSATNRSGNRECRTTITNITERKLAEQELHKHREHLEELVQERTRKIEDGRRELWSEIIVRREADKALRESEEKFHTIADFTIDWEYWRAPDGAFIYVSPSCERITGYSADEFMARPELFLSIIHPSYRKIMTEHLEHQGEQHAFAADFVIITKTGEERWISHRCQPVIRGGTNMGRRASCRDVTERKNLEAQLLQAQKMEAIGRLAGGIAHDFNNLLTAITGFGSLVRDSLSPGDGRRGDLDMVLDAARSATDLTRQLCTFSRHQSLFPQVIDMNAMTLNLGKLLRHLVSENIEIAIVPATEPVMVKADTSMLEQVIINLVVNARDAMPAGGLITIMTSRESIGKDSALTMPGVTSGDFVRLEITDTGLGMTKEVMTHIFEPFFTTKEIGKGTGFGLATVYGIVKHHQGNIQFHSADGKGTTFTIYLPMVDAKHPEIDGERPEMTMPGGKETVLVVEDVHSVRQFTARILKSLGYTVLEAENGEEALRLSLSHQGKIHLLLTDVVMPLMSGTMLGEKMKAARPDMSVLFMSGYTEENLDELVQLKKHRGFVQKPFTARTIAVKIRELLDCEDLVT